MTNKAPRPWIAKLFDAIRGVGLGVRRELNLRIHCLAAILCVAMAGWLQCDRVEWCLLMGCVGLVFTAELLNSALEAIFHGLDEAAKARISGCLDMAAGAVLVTATTSVVIGGLIFVPRLLALRS
jgi:diacylglycerol kinase